MGVGMDGPPNVYTAGSDFDYSVWTAGTQIDLVNVNWNNDYRDVVKFASKDTLNAYINSLQSAGIRLNNLTYAKPNQDIFLPIPYNRVNRYNYLRASNPLMPIQGDIQKDFYYFILDCEYINPQTTRIRVQLDVWQTYVYDVTIGNCYVERGHIGIANTNQFNNFGRDYLTVPEGLDIGADYRVIAKRTEDIVELGASLTYNHDIIVVSTTDLLAEPGTVEAPHLTSGQGSFVQGMPSGAGFYVWEDANNFATWLRSMSEFPWVTQGIVSITVMPKINRYGTFTYTGGTAPQLVNIRAHPIKHEFFPNWRNSPEILQWIPAKYQHLKKMFTAPYMAIEATTWTGTPVALRPEVWASANAEFMERANYMPPNQRVQFVPRKYNSSGQAMEAYFGLTDAQLHDLAYSLPVSPAEQEAFYQAYRELGDDFGDYLDIITQIAGFPSLPAVNNMALGYLAANAHSINYSRETASWTQQRALGLAQGQFDIASGGMRTADRLNDIAVDAGRAQAISQNTNIQGQANVGAIGSVAAGAISGGGGGASAGVGGAAAGAGLGAAVGAVNGLVGIANAGIQAAHNTESSAIANLASMRSTATNISQARLSRDTNQDLAQFSARGDYANAIAGVNARVQDAAMIQPSVAGQFGGDATNIAGGTMEFSIRWKLIDAAALRIVGDYWLRFGYAIRAFIRPPQSLMVMTKFTYWKMTESYLSSAMVPEGHKQVLRGIMEKGFTVWANPADIGNIDIADNAPLPGVSY
jgi:hypothetical protein